MFLISDDTWTVKQTKKRGRGIFAKKDIDAGTVIGDYLGKVIHTSEEDAIDESKNFYLMHYHERASIFPDLSKPGVHLINHACTPNCWMTTYRGHTLFFALRRIFKDEELTVAYLVSPQDKYCDPCTHICTCGSVICSQTMHLSEKRYNTWITFHDKEAKKTKRERVRFGQNLPKLSSYPKNVSDNPIYTLFGTTKKAAHTLQEKELPSVTTLRKLIRATGKTLQFPALNIHVLGMLDDLIISQRVS